MNDKEYIDQYLPTVCPACGEPTIYDHPHLKCVNLNCVGKSSKKLESACGVLDLKGVGGKTLIPFASDFENMLELWIWVLSNENHHSFNEYGLPLGSRSHEIFIKAFKNIKSLPYAKMIQIIGYENVGKTLSKELGKKKITVHIVVKH